MKKIMTGLLLSTMILSTVGTTITDAAEKKIPTKGDITFVEGGDEVTPDPNPDPNPDPDPDPNPDPDPIDNGALKFTTLPNIHFGEVELSAQSISYYYADFLSKKYDDNGTSEDGVYPTFYTVQDVRGGAKGWKVSVSHNGKFVNKEDSTDVFKGSIQLNNSSVKTNTFTDPSDIKKYEPTSEITAMGTAYVSISSEASQEVQLMKADAGKGYGKWSQSFGDSSKVTTGQGNNGDGSTGKVNPKKKDKNLGVRLQFPAQVVKTETGKNTYEAIINWNLNDTL